MGVCAVGPGHGDDEDPALMRGGRVDRCILSGLFEIALEVIRGGKIDQLISMLIEE